MRVRYRLLFADEALRLGDHGRNKGGGNRADLPQ